MITTAEGYALYLRTTEWHVKRANALAKARHRCQVCNSTTDLEVHHRTYERVGHEDDSDLTVLCELCHEMFHAGGRMPKFEPGDKPRPRRLDQATKDVVRAAMFRAAEIRKQDLQKLGVTK